jgi:hypothetical protein
VKSKGFLFMRQRLKEKLEETSLYIEIRYINK